MAMEVAPELGALLEGLLQDTRGLYRRIDLVGLDTQQQGQVKPGIQEIIRLGGELAGEGNV